MIFFIRFCSRKQEKGGPSLLHVSRAELKCIRAQICILRGLLFRGINTFNFADYPITSRANAIKMFSLRSPKMWYCGHCRELISIWGVARNNGHKWFYWFRVVAYISVWIGKRFGRGVFQIHSKIHFPEMYSKNFWNHFSIRILFSIYFHIVRKIKIRHLCVHKSFILLDVSKSNKS